MKSCHSDPPLMYLPLFHCYINRVYQLSTMEQSKHFVALMILMIGSPSGHIITLAGEVYQDITSSYQDTTGSC